MKNYINYFTVLLLMFSYSVVKAQEIATNSEIKLNAPLALAGFVEGTYEYILSDESGIGVSAGFAYDDIFFNANVTPFYRFYFGKKRAAGFFVEGSGSIYTQDYEQSVVVNGVEVEDKSEIGAGLGVAIGFKILTVRKWIFEAYTGGGRNFINEDKLDGGYVRIGLNIGKRF